MMPRDWRLQCSFCDRYHLRFRGDRCPSCQRWDVEPPLGAKVANLRVRNGEPLGGDRYQILFRRFLEAPPRCWNCNSRLESHSASCTDPDCTRPHAARPRLDDEQRDYERIFNRDAPPAWYQWQGRVRLGLDENDREHRYKYHGDIDEMPIPSWVNTSDPRRASARSPSPCYCSTPPRLHRLPLPDSRSVSRHSASPQSSRTPEQEPSRQSRGTQLPEHDAPRLNAQALDSKEGLSKSKPLNEAPLQDASSIPHSSIDPTGLLQALHRMNVNRLLQPRQPRRQPRSKAALLEAYMLRPTPNWTDPIPACLKRALGLPAPTPKAPQKRSSVPKGKSSSRPIRQKPPSANKKDGWRGIPHPAGFPNPNHRDENYSWFSRAFVDAMSPLLLPRDLKAVTYYHQDFDKA